MSDSNQEEAHTGPIKTPQQLLWAAFFSFVVPVFINIGLVYYVVSDSNAVEYLHNKHHVAASPDEAAAMYLREGGNVRTAFKPPETFILPVRREIAAGKLSMEVIDSRVSDVLRVKFLEGLFDKPYVDADDANDQPTLDLLTQRLDIHEKNAWMLRSLLKK